MAECLSVNIPDEVHRSYDIVIERGLLEKLGVRALEFGLHGSVVIVTNPTVEKLYARQLAEALPCTKIALMQDGERYKNLDTVQTLYDQLLAVGSDRHTSVVALGGGVVGDTVGYVAATFMRGVRLIQIPTTLLAMVDSSVGGKVGVDLPQGKNLVGAFKNPDYVLIDPDVLHTLPDAQWRCGMAEVIKHGLLADESLLDTALHIKSRAAELVKRAIQVKINVVEADPYEHSIRAHLNLGHTFAHAIEKVTHYAWLHGDAVGFGLLAAAKLSHTLELCDESLVQQVKHLLAETGLPHSLNGLDPEAIWNAMLTDKKWKTGRSRFVVLAGMNQPTIVEDVERDVVIRVLEELS